MPSTPYWPGTEPTAKRAVIEVKKRARLQDLRSLALEDLSILDDYLDAADAPHGAPITFSAPPLRVEAPKPEHVKPPSGRDVLLFHL